MNMVRQKRESGGTIPTDPDNDRSKPGLIDFVSDFDDREETILLIHGACASASDWSLVVPYLSAYHLLVPSLFTQSTLNIVRKSRDVSLPDQPDSSSPHRWDSCYISHLADLVRVHAKNSRAHIVGLSFGACLGAKMTAVFPSICSSLFTSGLPVLVAPPLYSVVKPLGTGLFWVQHAIVKAVGASIVNKFLEGEVQTDPGAWDGKGGGSTVEMNGILTETVIYRGSGEYYVGRIRVDPDVHGQGATPATLRLRHVAASRKSRWTPVGDSPEWITEVGKIMVGERKGASDTTQGVLVNGVDCRVYEAKQMFHPWSRQDPELFAQCILATVTGTDFPTQGLQEIWRNSPTSSSGQ